MEARRAPPAVPPKPPRPRRPLHDGPVPAPLVPRSCRVGAPVEPSYSSRLNPYANDVAAPPSPVSSSYSELRRASDRPDAYESLYEPIEPRASPGPQVAAPPPPDPRSPSPSSYCDGDADSYGVCARCGTPVVGSASGCTAMNKVYHVQCFTCRRCAANLQGEPFYALDGEPHCREDYLNTLEKCCVCMRPILDRILRATGKPYHPQCFTCVVCGRSLDGVPFTVDSTNRIHCIEDFHNKFAPRCCACRRPIMREPGSDENVRVVALDRSFHVGCYRCEDCGLPLSTEAEGRGCYPLDDHVLCKSCNAKRVQALTSDITTEL